MSSPHYPRVASVKPQPNGKLLVWFDNGIAKVYDCTPLFEKEPFRRLADESFFRLVRADPHGYAVIWDDETDLAESELWLNGAPAEPMAADTPR
jgi:hypothetical protein